MCFVYCISRVFHYSKRVYCYGAIDFAYFLSPRKPRQDSLVIRSRIKAQNLGVKPSEEGRRVYIVHMLHRLYLENDECVGT